LLVVRFVFVLMHYRLSSVGCYFKLFYYVHKFLACSMHTVWINKLITQTVFNHSNTIVYRLITTGCGQTLCQAKYLGRGVKVS